jgi:ABC-type multidrug transport system permease subunit
MAEVEPAQLHGEIMRNRSISTLPQPQGKATFHPLIEMTLARLRESMRQPEALFWVFIFPMMMAFALGIAFRNTAPEKIKVAVDSASADASAIVTSLAKSERLDAVLLSSEEAARHLRTGKVALVVKASHAAAQKYDFTFDATRPDSQSARYAVDDALQRAAGRKDLAEIKEQTITETGARYIDFLIPGLLGMNLMSSGLWGLGFVLVQARMQKLLKRLAATPMKRWHFLMSFILSRLIFLAFEILAVLAFAYFVFGAKVQGSVLSFFLIAVIGSMTFAGMGLVIAARPQTIEGVSGLINAAMLPMWLLSGTFFSSSRFPDFAQPFIKLLPLTALNDSLRAVMNEGASLFSVWPAIAVMLVWGIVSFLLALKIFRWQ